GSSVTGAPRASSAGANRPRSASAKRVTIWPSSSRRRNASAAKNGQPPGLGAPRSTTSRARLPTTATRGTPGDYSADLGDGDGSALAQRAVRGEADRERCAPVGAVDGEGRPPRIALTN